MLLNHAEHISESEIVLHKENIFKILSKDVTDMVKLLQETKNKLIWAFLPNVWVVGSAGLSMSEMSA